MGVAGAPPGAGHLADNVGKTQLVHPAWAVVKVDALRLASIPLMGDAAKTPFTLRQAQGERGIAASKAVSGLIHATGIEGGRRRCGVGGGVVVIPDSAGAVRVSWAVGGRLHPGYPAGVAIDGDGVGGCAIAYPPYGFTYTAWWGWVG